MRPHSTRIRVNAGDPSSRVSEAPSASVPALSVFSFMTALSALFHNRHVFTRLSDFMHPVNALTIMVVALALWLMFKPSSLPRFLAFVVMNVIGIFIKLPIVPNHFVFALLVYVTIIVAWLVPVLARKHPLVDRRSFYETFAPVLRVELLVLYFWVTVHKLNRDFFNTDISAATLQYFHIKDMLPFLPAPDWLLNAAVYGTVTIEGLIPVLLFLKRTRLFAILLAFSFHSLLGLGYPGFSVFLYAMFSLFVPQRLYSRAAEDLRKVLSKTPAKLARLLKGTRKSTAIRILIEASAYLLLFILLALLFRQQIAFLHFDTNVSFFLVIVLALALLISWRLLFRKLPLPAGDHLFAFRYQLFWIFPLMVFLNGLTPHLGLKNTQVFAMFSNLKTEGGQTNHFFIPQSWQISGYLSDLVQINRSSDPVLHQFGQFSRGIYWNSTFVLTPRSYLRSGRAPHRAWRFQIPYFMLRVRITQLRVLGVKNIRLDYIRNGRRIILQNAESDPGIADVSYWLQKFLLLRGVPAIEAGLCMW